MSRSRARVTLEAGLKLDLNRLIRRGYIRRGACIQGEISWTESFSGEQIASGIITADMVGEFGGWLRVDLGELKQTITLTSLRP